MTVSQVLDIYSTGSARSMIIGLIRASSVSVVVDI